MTAECLRKVAVIAEIEGMNTGAFSIFERLLVDRAVDFGDLSINEVCGLVRLARDIFNEIYIGLGH